MYPLLIVAWVIAVVAALSFFPSIAGMYGMTLMFPEGRNWRTTAFAYGWIAVFASLMIFNPFK